MPQKLSPRTTGALAIAGVDIARHLARAWASRQERVEHEHALHSLFAERADEFRGRAGGAVRAVAKRTPQRMRRRLPDWAAPDPWYVEHRRTVLAAAATGLVVGAAVAVAGASRRLAGAPPVSQRARAAALDVHDRATAGEPALRTSIQATGAATVAAIDAVASDASAATTAARAVAADELDRRVTQPVRAKATRYGALAIAGLTAYVAIVSVVVQVVVAQLS